MTLQEQIIDSGKADALGLTPGVPTAEPEIDQEQRYRASAYGLLAALLRASPEQALLDQLLQLAPLETDPDDELSIAMSALAQAAASADMILLEEEYQALFIGLGKGEVVPYGSWHLTGFLMEQPLSDLRDALKLLGLERSGETHEPEDHVAALCEVMAVLINDAASLEQQKQFFNNHMQAWVSQFMADLANAESADFYKCVARFGSAFIELDKAYMAMQS